MEQTGTVTHSGGGDGSARPWRTTGVRLVGPVVGRGSVAQSGGGAAVELGAAGSRAGPVLSPRPYI